MAAALKVSSLNGVQIYNVAAGKTNPQWAEEAKKQKTNLRYNEEYRRRIELIQDFDMPTASNRIKVSPNRKFIAVSGVYKPRIRMFEVEQLGMKFERYIVRDRAKECSAMRCCRVKFLT